MASPATPYSPQGSLALPRVHIPTWYGSLESSSNGDARLNLNVITQITPTVAASGTNNLIEDSTDYIMTIANGTNISNTESRKHNRITIGSTVPSLGTIEAYSDDSETLLSNAKSAHVLFLEHAVVKSFNFKIPHNHVIDRIEKWYRAENGTSNQTLSTVSGNLLIIHGTNENDATVSQNTEVLNLVEGGH